MVRVYYCSACGKRIPLEEIEEDRAVEIDGLMYCAECAEAEATVVTAEEVEVVPAGPLYCDRCKALIEPEDLQSGKAVAAGGHSYCAKCTTMYLPLLEALKAKEETPSEESAHHRRRTPAYGMRAVSTERSSEAHAPPYESKSNATAILGAVAGVVVLIIIIAVVLSGGQTTTTPPRGGGTGGSGDSGGTGGSGLGANNPEPYIPPATADPPGFVEDPQVKKLIESADAFAEANPDSYDAVISRYEEIERNNSLSSTQSSHVRMAVSNAVEKRRRRAETERDRVMAEADKFEKKNDYAGAVAALRKYPAGFKSVEECWTQIQARIEMLGKNEKAQGPYDVLMMQVDALKQAEKEEDAIAELKKFAEEHSGSSFADKASKLMAELSRTVAKRKADRERAEREAREKAKAALEAMRVGDPLYYTDFSAEDVKTNLGVTYKDCNHTKRVGVVGEYTLSISKPNATAIFEFELLESPKYAILRFVQEVPSHPRQEIPNVVLTFELNGNALVKNKTYGQADAPSVMDFENIETRLVKGKNKLILTQTSGSVGWCLQKVELLVHYEDAGTWDKEKKRAQKSGETAQAAYKSWLASRDKEKEKEAKKAAREFEKGAQPALKTGKKYDLLKSKSISKGWKIWGKGGEWKFENGELVGRNNNLQLSAVLTTLYKNQHEWKDLVLTFKASFENSCEHSLIMRAQYPNDKNGMPGPCLISSMKATGATLGQVYEFMLVIENGKCSTYTDGKVTVKDHVIAPHLGQGYLGIQLGPNATVHIKEMTLELKR